MQSRENNKLALQILICCIATVVTTVTPAQAVDRSRVLTVGLFVSGAALKFGSTFVATSAQDTYDQYLSTGIQADIVKHRDDYKTKRDLSLGMSRAGVGFVGIAVLISFFDQLDVISKPSAARSVRLSLNPSYNPRTGDAALTFQRKF